MTEAMSVGPMLGVGIGTQNEKGEWLEVYFPFVRTGNEAKSLAVSLDITEKVTAVDQTLREKIVEADICPIAEATIKPVVCYLTKDDAPESVPEAYLKLHLLSKRLVRPHEINLSGIFKSLPNVAWTNEGAVDLAELDARRLKARTEGKLLKVYSVDKFPAMTDYVVPEGVRIADTARVRLGAYIGKGTTIMHEGFVNFNAGCEGPNMIEGRISAGVYVGQGSDLGGGCSTMGTLSGGNETVISIGKDCLIGANAGVGIPLGDACTVEAGLYLTAGAKLTIIDKQGNTAGHKKARDLAGEPGLLFRRNSQTGQIECLPNPKAIKLNEELHKNN